ncbi:hypothetical protein BBO99_00006647 [Phytophthora kernoviae]|uniref:GAF domain-containing protein n=1 Tax=Phytophthora kernoviae TaxID=325452 RepID=A0A3R7H4E7_9STRA|nr:hypothetical protein JM16_008008 [Phytophthora kernoviae]RLN20126.1 hypothetical protein BBI17_006664 [Phytophthora kernoviae]RLN77548.1 hypothetical protein BBO99_00006647 [Phytophthora kernoviae]
MPFKTSRRSPISSDVGTTASSPEHPSRKVLVDDNELARRARSASASVALERALAYPTDLWDSKKSTPYIPLGSSDPDTECFAIFSRISDSAGGENEVLTTGDIACSPQELVSVLRSSNENDYNSVMKGLYGSQYIYGSVVHVIKGGQSTQELVEVPEGHQLAVKTSCFVRSRLFARNEQWCFLEYFQPVEKAKATAAPAPDAAQGFSVAFVSMSEQELVAGKAVGDRVDQLDGITALCVVEPVGDAKKIERRGPVQIVDDPVDNSSSAPTGNSLRESLAAENTKTAAVTVVKMLLSRQSSNAKTMSSSDNESSVDESENEDEDEEGYMTAVQEYFQRRAHEAPPAADCVLANAEQRTYPLELVETSPSAPFPQNELARLECINTLGLMSLKDPMPELDIICSFLSKELGFFCTMITIVGERHQLVLSCTMPGLVQALLPREHTFCQHLLMGDAPFIVRNPEADVRFYNLNPVTKQGVKFYCGIPIMGPHGIMVGSICCVHFEAMNITRSQYDTLQRFGQIASKIIRVKVEAMLKPSAAP